MKEIGHLKTYKMKLTTLSPVFIGGGETLSSLDYCYDTTQEQLNIIDEEKFSKFLVEKNLLEDFTNYVINNKYAKLFAWGKERNIKLTNYPIFKRRYKYSNNDIKNLNNINLFIKNIKGEAYIPGSSIKGAIRTAVLSKMIKDNSAIRKKYKALIKMAIANAFNKKDITKAIRPILNTLEQDLLSLSPKDGRQKKEILDIFRGIQVSDSSKIDDLDMGLYKKIDYPLHARSVGERPLYRECIRPYVSVDFTITFDSNIVEEKGIDIKYILEAFDEFTKDWHDLLKVFDDDLDRANIYMPSDEEDYKANFCIGGGSGFLTKTVFYTIFDDKKEALELVRKYLDIAFKSIHKHIQKDKEISPRTLKLAKDRGDYINIGWCNIQEVKI